jgi:hypothetical protein
MERYFEMMHYLVGGLTLLPERIDWVIMLTLEPLAKVLPFMVRYLTTNGESTVYDPTPPFVLRYRRARRRFCKRLA